MSHMLKRGVFITLEGIEGVGKSTQVDFIKHYLQQHGITLVCTREPGGTPIAEQIRQLLLACHEEPLLPVTEMLLLFAGRYQHIETVIRPALKAGKWVLSDRFVDASYAYQGGGRGVSTEHLDHLAACVQGDLFPDCVLWLDLPVSIALQRVQTRGHLDRIEQEAIGFFERARAMYAQRAKTCDYYQRIDANQTLAQVQQDIKIQLDKLLKAHAIDDKHEVD